MNSPDGFPLPDRYEVREVLVSTDAEVVYRGVDRTLEREVLLKRPGPALARTLADTGDTSRALREARALARVRHDGIVRLLDVVECDGGPLLVLEPTPGETLADRLDRDGRLAPADVRRLGERLADALEAVHASGAVHRGLSAANIVLRPDGTPCLAGFLFAKFGGPSIGLSSISYGTGEPVGDSARKEPRVVPSHPAPEQLHGQVADARSDVFGLGCVLYRCLTGAQAFEDLVASGWSPPAPPRDLAPDAPDGLADAIMQCLARSPLARFPTAREAGAAFAAVETGRSRPGGRRVSAAAAAAVLAVAAAAVGFLLRDDAGARAGDAPRGEPVVVAGGRPDRARGPHRPAYAESHALLVGIDTPYPAHGFARLPNALADVDALAARLPSLGFGSERTTVLRDAAATGVRIRRELGRLAADLDADDRLLVYFAGHGERHDRAGESGWLIPADGAALARDRTRSTWLRFEEVAAVSRETRAKHVLIALDCCYAGRIAPDRSLAERRFEERYLTQDAHFVLCSGRDEPVSDGAGAHSPFAASLLAALAEDRVALTASELALRIERDFLDRDLDQQVRFAPLSGKGDGEFVFFLDGAE